MTEDFQIPEKMNEILATMYEERIGKYYEITIVMVVESMRLMHKWRYTKMFFFRNCIYIEFETDLTA